MLGVKGDVFDGKWDYDVFAQTGKVLYQETYRNDFSKTRTQLALDVVANPNGGAPVCRITLTDPTNPDPAGACHTTSSRWVA